MPKLHSAKRDDWRHDGLQQHISETLNMTWRIFPAAITWLAVGLTGCADRAPAPPPPVATAPPPAHAVSIDGTYNGLMQLTSGMPTACGTSNVFALVVQGHAFRYVLDQPEVPWQPQRVFTASILPDGSFQAGTGVAYMRGTLSQGHMQGQIVGDACQFQFEADSVGTF
jgi:hypothetical protein